MMTIDVFKDHETEEVKKSIRDIFFLSADPKNISADELQNTAFFAKWTQYYFAHRPEWILLAWEGDALLAYLMCEPDSLRALDYYEKVNPSYGLFRDQFAEFPAHLHMNAHPVARGRGVGSKLIADLVTRLDKIHCRGVHLVTSPEQRNVKFYRQNGFTHEIKKEWKGHPLLFMGRHL